MTYIHPLLFETLLQIISAMSQLNGLAISDKMNCISGVMVRMLAFSVIDCGLQSWANQSKDYKIDICCFSAGHAALRSHSNDWLAQNQDNVSKWSEMSICGLLFQWSDMSICGLLFQWSDMSICGLLFQHVITMKI